MKIFGIVINFTKAPRPIPEWGVNIMSTVALNCQRLDIAEQTLEKVRCTAQATERKVYREAEKEVSGGNGERQVSQRVAEIASLQPGATVSPAAFAVISQSEGG